MVFGVDARANNFLWTKFWKAWLPSKILHFLWKCVYDCVPVKGRLSRYIVDINHNCPFCNKETEDVEHLLTDFDISKAISQAMDINSACLCSGMRLSDWIASWFAANGNSAEANRTMVEMAAFTLWKIWKLCCVVVFDNAQVNMLIVVSLSKQYRQYWVTNNNNQFIRDHHRTRVRVHVPWKRPPESFTKVIFDASFSKYIKLMGTGLIVVDDAGEWRAAGCTPAVAQDAEKAEARAALDGIKWAVANQVVNLQI
ncbi:uncharacterized protein LOC113291639 [Papaver somniferum]|uniref:uncharacterized protein LOC113291639 n=1 Tax=Papaver somniferum TaxID=3469 RepID=UPI000E7047BF|nr:uncharacterized protein LOC113291639 [Papaver somniferum]